MTLKDEDILQMKQDQYISSIINIEINSEMPVSTLYALETIFYLRLQLEQASCDANVTLYEDICRDRFEQISKALIEKYRKSKSINEKTEILERIEVISLNLDNVHSLFALEEASIMEELPNLTYAQKLRLKWLLAITPGDDSKIAAELLPQTDGSFEVATLALISDFCTDKERAAIFDRYLELFDAALSANDTAELGNLLALAASWNSNPSVRFRLTEAANKAASIGSLTLPEKRVNTSHQNIRQNRFPHRQILGS